MKRKLFAASLTILVALSACSSSKERTSSAFDSGYDSGYSDGYEAGKRAALEDMPDIDDIIYEVHDAANDYVAKEKEMNGEDACMMIEAYQHSGSEYGFVSWQEYMDAIDALTRYYSYFESRVYWGEFSYGDFVH